jgi:hypothetical protein
VPTGYHNSRSDTQLNGLAWKRLEPASLLQHEILADACCSTAVAVVAFAKIASGAKPCAAARDVEAEYLGGVEVDGQLEVSNPLAGRLTNAS